jgi:hypothetical protein
MKENASRKGVSKLKTISLIFGGFTLLFVVLLSSQASAAGCNLKPREYLLVCGDGCGAQVGGMCVGAGTSGTFCYNGYGNCCGADFTTSNGAPDGTCGGKVIPFSKSKPTYWARRYDPRLVNIVSCNGSLTTTQLVSVPFTIREPNSNLGFVLAGGTK